MAVIAPIDANSTLSTANDFYRVEAHNLSNQSATTLSLSSARSASFTPLNAVNALGAAICLRQTGAFLSSTMKEVTVTLKEGSTARASKTLTAADITKSTSAQADGWWVYFEFTAPYAITTAPATWSIEVTNATGTNNWSLRTSNGTAISFFLVGDGVVSFANDDCLCCTHKVTIDQSASIKGVTSTGDTTNGIAAVICRGTDGTEANVANLVVDSPASSYTLTVDGVIQHGAHSAFRAGTSASRISYANKFILDFISPTVGTTSGFAGTSRSVSVFGRKECAIFYGEIPSDNRDTLAANAVLGGTVTISNATPAVITKASHGYSNGMPIIFTTTGSLPTGLSINTRYYVVNAASGTFNVEATVGGEAIATSSAGSGTHTVSPVLVTTGSTGWSTGDIIAVGERSSRGTQDTTDRTIQWISGTEIMLSAPLTGSTALAGASVIKMNGYGIKIKMNTVSSSNLSYIKCPSHLIFSGVEFENFSLISSVSSGLSADDAGNMSVVTLKDCGIYYTATSTTVAFTIPPNEKGLDVQNTNSFKCPFLSVGTVNYATTMTTLNVKNNISVQSSNGTISLAGQPYIVVEGNYIENNGANTPISGTRITVKNNYFKALSTARTYSNIINPIEMSGDTIKNCAVGMSLTGLIIGATAENYIFSGNATDLTASASVYVDIHFDSPTGSLSLDVTNLPSMIDGTAIRISDNNDVSNDDIVYTPLGYFKRTGYGLSDTTVWNGTSFTAGSAGETCLRFQPTSSATPLVYVDNERSTIIGNCQNSPVLISARIKINNATYYAGTHTKPTLKVTYDGGTVVSAVASGTTDAQHLQVVFTPTTTIQDVKIEILGATDATGTNAYFYLGELLVNTPPGNVIDTTRMGSFNRALPLGTFRTIPTPDVTWDLLTANHQVSGSFGEQATRTEIKTDDATALILAK